jgi:hypothetical protein
MRSPGLQSSRSETNQPSSRPSTESNRRYRNRRRMGHRLTSSPRAKRMCAFFALPG